MAAAVVSVEDQLSCPICFELFVDPNTPKNLPSCGHVLCEICLNEIVEGKYQQTCPECRIIINTPVGGISSFTTNYRLRSLAENHQTFGHDIPQRQISLKKAGIPLCLDHDEKMHYYCVICNSLACQACLTLKHNGTGHNIKGVKEMHDEQKAEMKCASGRAKSRIIEIESVLRELKTAEIQNTEFYQNKTKEIDEYTECHINELLRKCQELKAQVERAKQLKAEQLKRESATVQKHLDSVKVAYRAVVSATENLSDCEYITQHNILVNKIKDIQMSKITTDVSQIKQDNKEFVPGFSDMKLEHITPVEACARALKWIETLDGWIQAGRLDCTSDGLLTVTDVIEKKVVIYRRTDGKYEKKLDLKLAPNNHHKPHGIAGCSDGFMVAMFTCIEVYSPEGNHRNPIKIEGLVDVHRVQVTSDGRILVGDQTRSLIMEISKNGKVIRTVYISIKPRHMTLIKNTHIAVSDWESGKVIVVHTESGQETLSIDIKRVTGICYDEHTECLLIARSEPEDELGKICLNTGVIEQYSYTTGKLIACLQQGLLNPQGMALTSEGHLFVANTETVEVYEIQ